MGKYRVVDSNFTPEEGFEAGWYKIVDYEHDYLAYAPHNDLIMVLLMSGFKYYRDDSPKGTYYNWTEIEKDEFKVELELRQTSIWKVINGLE